MGFNYDAGTDGFYKNYQSDPFDDLQDEEPEITNEKEYGMENLDELLEDVAQDLLTQDPTLMKLKKKHEHSMREMPEDDIKTQFSTEGVNKYTQQDRDEDEQKMEEESLIEVELELETIATYKKFCLEFGGIRKEELIDFAGGIGKKKIKEDDPKVGDEVYTFEFNKKSNRIERRRKILKKIMEPLPQRKVDRMNLSMPLLDELERQEKHGQIIPRKEFNDMSLTELEKFENDSKLAGAPIILEKEKRLARLKERAVDDVNSALYLAQMDAHEAEFTPPQDPNREPELLPEPVIIPQKEQTLDLEVVKDGKYVITKVPRKYFEEQQEDDDYGDEEFNADFEAATELFEEEKFQFMKEEFPFLNEQQIQQYLELGEDDDPIVNQKRQALLKKMMDLMNMPQMEFEDLMKDVPDSTEEEEFDAKNAFYEKQREELKDIFDQFKFDPNRNNKK